jgi:hypothetical protein
MGDLGKPINTRKLEKPIAMAQILIVEDDLLQTTYLTIILEKYGMWLPVRGRC